MKLTLTRRGRGLLGLLLATLGTAILVAAFNHGQDRRCTYLRDTAAPQVQINTFCP